MTIGEWGSWVTVALAAGTLLLPRSRLRLDLLAAASSTVVLLALGRMFAIEDWSSAYVADHARPGTNPFLRLAGMWAGAEGSLLLWLAMVAWAAVIASTLAPEPARAATRRCGAALTTGYGLVLVVTATPFERLAVPANGGLGLQPVLEHPAMVWHPPLLYAGLVGLLIPMLMGLGAAWSRPPETWPSPGDATAMTVVAGPLALLTAGLITGALWANVELGWGGFWAWDPIESAGLVAWLAGAALVHLIRRPHHVIPDRRVATTLTLLPGLAAVGATTVTRIGVVASVHAFADRPALRLGLVLVAAGVVAGAMGAVARSSPGVGPGPELGPEADDHQTMSGTVPAAARRPGPRWAGRRHATVALTVAAVFVAIGTYEPVVEAATTGDRLAIAGQYHTRLLWPVVIAGAALAVRADRRWWPAAAGAATAAATTPWAAGPFGLAVALAGGAVAGSALSLANRRPGALAHLGVGLALVGVAGTMATTSTVVSAAVDSPIEVDGRSLVHRSIELRTGTDTTEAVATIEYDGVIHRPRLVSFDRRSAATAELSRRTDGLDEVQVLLLDGDRSAADYRINHLPRLHLVWLGGALVAVGLVQPRRRLRSSRAESVEPSSSGVPSSDGAGADGVAADGAGSGDGAAVGGGEAVGGPDGGAFDGGPEGNAPGVGAGEGDGAIGAAPGVTGPVDGLAPGPRSG